VPINNFNKSEFKKENDYHSVVTSVWDLSGRSQKMWSCRYQYINISDIKSDINLYHQIWRSIIIFYTSVHQLQHVDVALHKNYGTGYLFFLFFQKPTFNQNLSSNTISRKLTLDCAHANIITGANIFKFCFSLLKNIWPCTNIMIQNAKFLQDNSVWLCTKKAILTD